MANMTFGVNLIPNNNAQQRTLGNSDNKWEINASTVNAETISGNTVANNLTTTTSGKVLDARQGKTLDDNKLDKNFSIYTVASTPYNGNELIPIRLGNTNLVTTINELTSASSGSSSAQSALITYTKNCGEISSLPATITDSNITADMIVLKATLGTPSAQTGNWTITTADGSATITGNISGTTTVLLYFGVGMTVAPSLLINLASTNADNILKTAPRPGVMGILSIANGGTGANTANNACENIGAVKKSGDRMTGKLEIVNSGEQAVKIIRENGARIDFANTTQDLTRIHSFSNGQFAIRSLKPGVTNYYDEFHLPAPETTNENKSYSILTTKSPVTIPQGGTGATDAAGARANLGLGTRVVCGTKATPSVANGTTEELTTISIPSAGVWQVIFSGFSPIMASNKVNNQATNINIFVPSNSSVSWGSGSYNATCLYAMNATCMFKCTDAVTVTLKITNWEGSAMTAGTDYSFYAVRVG